MTDSDIRKLLNLQKKFFNTGKTISVDFRIMALKRLKTTILSLEKDITTALKSDLGKSYQESYMCEIGMTLSEITYMLKHIRSFSRPKPVYTPLSQFPAISYTKPSPYGNVLIMSPWNYPFLLTMEPLIDALAAGNTAILKPSAYSPATNNIIEKIIRLCFPEKYVAVVTGGREENTSLLNCNFDYIFFTGSKSVGKEVMQKAAAHLTPVTLELGGKSPCIVDKSANIPLAARRIVFGKFLNCGQTCVAPDYIICHASVKDKLIKHIISEIKKQFGTVPLTNPDYGKIINEKHFKRLTELIDKKKTIYGGQYESHSLRIEPTVMKDIIWEDKIMDEEIFGPLLPILTYTNTQKLISDINNRPHPLALYVFSENKSFTKYITSQILFGGGCINDTIIHLATSEMGFGGVGESGMGSYHGREGFNTFSHKKSIVDKKTWLDLPIRYQPYNGNKIKLIKALLS